MAILDIRGFLQATCIARTSDEVTLCITVNNPIFLLIALGILTIKGVGPLGVFAMWRTASDLNSLLTGLGGWPPDRPAQNRSAVFIPMLRGLLYLESASLFTSWNGNVCKIYHRNGSKKLIERP